MEDNRSLYPELAAVMLHRWPFPLSCSSATKHRTVTRLFSMKLYVRERGIFSEDQIGLLLSGSLLSQYTFRDSTQIVQAR